MQKLKNKILQENKYKKLLHNEIEIKYVDMPTKNVDVNKVLKRLEDLIPLFMIEEHVEKIIFGNFDFFKKRDYNAFYDPKAKIIYIRSEQQDDNLDLMDDLIHEMSHAVENKYKNYIYSDGRIKSEFVLKRLKLFYQIVIDYGDKISSKKFLFTSYDEELDNFFYKTVGYEKMKKYIKNIFPSAYSPTSLSEYWAEGFEKYLLGDKSDLLSMCPRLYSKINSFYKRGNKNDI
tara:strand:- start:43 stop:738 length:696 start_codon:yes stop_codon:yes gene_type:complete